MAGGAAIAQVPLLEDVGLELLAGCLASGFLDPLEVVLGPLPALGEALGDDVAHFALVAVGFGPGVHHQSPDFPMAQPNAKAITT